MYTYIYTHCIHIHVAPNPRVRPVFLKRSTPQVVYALATLEATTRFIHVQGHPITESGQQASHNYRDQTSNPVLRLSSLCGTLRRSMRTPSMFTHPLNSP